jgi:hypothetical protein
VCTAKGSERRTGAFTVDVCSQEGKLARSVTRSWVQQALLPRIDWLKVHCALLERPSESVAQLLQVCTKCNAEQYHITIHHLNGKQECAHHLPVRTPCKWVTSSSSSPVTTFLLSPPRHAPLLWLDCPLSRWELLQPGWGKGLVSPTELRLFVE